MTGEERGWWNFGRGRKQAGDGGGSVCPFEKAGWGQRKNQEGRRRTIALSVRLDAEQADHHALDDQFGGGEQIGVTGILGAQERLAAL